MTRKGRPAKRSGGRSMGPMAKATNALPNSIATRRSRKNMTQTELAEIIGVSRGSIACWEAGTKAPSDLHKIALCKALKCTIQDLFDWEG